MHKHSHAILLIKNNEDKYLQYYDERWNCLLFVNCKLTDSSEKVINETIKESLVEKLSIDKKNIKTRYLFDKIHTKYSESAKKEKEYHHIFYKVDLENFSLNTKDKINGVEYIWYNIKELENNPRVMEINSDIIQFIKEELGD